MLTKHSFKYLLTLFAVLLLCLIPSRSCYAQNSTASSNYSVIIEDNADLLTEEEEKSLEEAMKKCAAFGNVMFLSVDSNPYYSTDSLSAAAYESTFGYSNGVIFTIDMDKRYLWICGFGNTQNIITSSYCDTITDNVYRYASDERYYDCTEKAFSQIYMLLNGKNIPQPMKYICNFLLSLILALIINYIFVIRSSKKRTASVLALKQNMIYHCSLSNQQAVFSHETKVYNPSTSSSGGGGGGGGGGGHSGGGHSF